MTPIAKDEIHMKHKWKKLKVFISLCVGILLVGVVCYIAFLFFRLRNQAEARFRNCSYIELRDFKGNLVAKINDPAIISQLWTGFDWWFTDFEYYRDRDYPPYSGPTICVSYYDKSDPPRCRGDIYVTPNDDVFEDISLNARYRTSMPSYCSILFSLVSKKNEPRSQP